MGSATNRQPFSSTIDMKTSTTKNFQSFLFDLWIKLIIRLLLFRLLCFTEPFLPCPFRSCVYMPVVFPSIVVPVTVCIPIVFLCSPVLILRPCIALVVSSHSFSCVWSCCLSEGSCLISRPPFLLVACFLGGFILSLSTHSTASPLTSLSRRRSPRRKFRVGYNFDIVALTY
ncbi:hypothetical protein EV421DRAFT_1049413 [Armillaria borealis]|uniref:Uncharacterized protein n=1 Tax=Armillaria borealis TaxID=47425 RepID=A0AA39K3P2_9AGAR|nr:hypothetical protein EV421DRAFT_1049413 [Armillaria borealis]